ncbi:MAG: phosphoserine phosphatase SerB [Succinivibrionaceae bacterium]
MDDILLEKGKSLSNLSLPECTLFSVKDNTLSILSEDYNGGYIVVIAKEIFSDTLVDIYNKCTAFGVKFGFIAPFNCCGNQVLIAKTNVYNADLNQELKKYPGTIDVVHVKEIPILNKPGVILLDMDSTCIQIECIDEIAKAYGVGEQIAEITSQAMHGLLDFKQSLRKRVSLLKNAPTSILEDLRNKLPIMPGFPELITLLQKNGWKVAIASGGFMPFVNKLKEDYNLTKVHANTFEIEGDHLTGDLIGEIVDSTVKVRTLHELLSEYNIPKSQSIAIGDGANDLPMICEAGLGFAIHAKPIVREKAPATINNFGLDAAACVLEARMRINRK